MLPIHPLSPPFMILSLQWVREKKLCHSPKVCWYCQAQQGRAHIILSPQQVALASSPSPSPPHKECLWSAKAASLFICLHSNILQAWSCYLYDGAGGE